MRANILRATNVVLGLLCLMYFLTYLDRVNISTAMASNQFLKEIPLTKTQAGLIFSAFAYPYLLFQISGGWVADKFGPRIALTICGIIWAGATIMTGMVHGLVMMFVARVVLGFGEGATFPTATRAMSYWMPKSKRGYAQGITHAFSRLGNSVTPWLVATLIAAISWRGSFIVVGVVSLFWALLWGLYFRNDPRQHRAITDEELAVLPPYAEKKGTVQVPWKRLGVRMIPVIVVYFCYGWTLWLFLSWIPSFFKNEYHLDLQSSALFSSGVFFAGVLGDTLGGIVSDKLFERTRDLNIARRNVVAVMMTLCCLSLVPVLFTNDIRIVTLALSAGFFCAEFTIGPMWAIPMDIAPKFSGTASGMMNTGSAFAAIVSPVVFGYIVDKTGHWTWPFMGSMALMLFGAALSFRMHPDRQLAEDSTAAGVETSAVSGLQQV
ncbi:MAG TPA: MFS transporter [Terriglobia bacterium]|nr:MFS transporter [Terriglobia bacterium]